MAITEKQHSVDMCKASGGEGLELAHDYICCILVTEASHKARLIGRANKFHSLFLGERNCKLTIQKAWLQIGVKNMIRFGNQSISVGMSLGCGDLLERSRNLLGERGILL